MKKTIGILVGVILLSGLIYTIYKGYESTKNKEDVAIEEKEKDVRIRKILSYDLENNYPNEYIDVLKAYTSTVEYIYSGIDNVDVEKAVEIQRQLLSKEVLKLNSKEEQIRIAKLDIKKKLSEGINIYSSKVYDTYQDSINNKIAVGSSLYYSTQGTGNNIDIEYHLIKEDGKWKVFHFRSKG